MYLSDKGAIEYEPSEVDILGELQKLVIDDYGSCAWELICDLDLFDDVKEFYYDDLKIIFEDEAIEGD
jgi:hypothetical protein